MDFKVVPLGLDQEESESLDTAIGIFNQSQEAFRASRDDRMDLDDAEVDWPVVRVLLEERYRESRVIGITSRPFVDNWFSHSENRITVISIDGWRDFYSPPGLHCYLLLEFTLAAYYHASNIGERESQPHDRAEGCLHDLCAEKRDVRWKLRVGNICAPHRDLFLAQGGDRGSLDAIQALLDEVRRVTLVRHAEDAVEPRVCPTTEFTMDSLRKHPLVVAATIFFLGLGLGWGTAWKTAVVPKNGRIADLEKQITDMEKGPLPTISDANERPDGSGTAH